MTKNQEAQENIETDPRKSCFLGSLALAQNQSQGHSNNLMERPSQRGTDFPRDSNSLLTGHGSHDLRCLQSVLTLDHNRRTDHRQKLPFQSSHPIKTMRDNKGLCSEHSVLGRFVIRHQINYTMPNSAPTDVHQRPVCNVPSGVI